MKEVVYCRGWFRARKAPVEIMDPNTAKIFHQKGELYTVVMMDSSKPLCFIEIRLELGYVGVGFLDRQLREYLSYTFSRQENGKLFLGRAVHRDFEGDSEMVTSGSSYFFSPIGKMRTSQINYGTNETTELERTLDVAGNWEQVPEFGQYEKICRFERISS